MVPRLLLLGFLILTALAIYPPRSPSPPSSVAPEAMPERRGCCSWHGGVCGCSNGRAKCCDGTLSPSCGCD